MKPQRSLCVSIDACSGSASRSVRSRVGCQLSERARPRFFFFFSCCCQFAYSRFSRTDEQKVKKKNQTNAAIGGRRRRPCVWVSRLGGEQGANQSANRHKRKDVFDFPKTACFLLAANKMMLAKIRFSNPDRRFDVKSIQSLFFTEKNQRLGPCRTGTVSGADSVAPSVLDDCAV